MGEKLGPVDIEFVLKNLNFKEESQRIRDQIKGISTTAQKEAAETNSILKTMGAGIAAYFSFQAISGFGQELINVRGEFQQLSIALETMLGSKAKADDLMAQVVDLAAKTPFTLTQVGQGAKQLLAFQVSQDDVIDTLTRLGNVAAGVSVPLDQLIRAYGQVKAKGRLQGDDMRQFTEAGIPLVNELAKSFGVTEAQVYKLVETGKVGFTDVQNVIKGLTDEGGMFFNLMEKQSKSLTGMVSNLSDAWDRMLNDIGTSNEGILAGGISSLTDLVNNYQKVIDITKVLVSTYGAYKAATILSTVATNGLTFAENLHYAALVISEKAQKLLNKTALANPYVAVATALTAVIGGLMLYNKWSEKSAKVSDEFKNNLKSEISAIDKSFEAVKKTAEGSEARKKAIQEINEKYKDYLPNLLSEKDGLDKIAEAQDKVTTAMAKSLAFKAQEKELEDIKKKTQDAKQAFSDLINEVFGNRKNYTAEEQGQATAALEKYLETAKQGEVTIKGIQEALSSFGVNVDINKQSNFSDLESIYNSIAGIDDKLLGKKTYLSALGDEKKAIAELEVVYNAYLKSLGLIGEKKIEVSGTGTKSKLRTVDVIDAEIAAFQKEQKTLSDTSLKWEEYNKKIEELQKERDAITGNKKDDKEQVKEQKSLDELLNQTASHEQKLLKLWQDYQKDKEQLENSGNEHNVAKLTEQYQKEVDAENAANTLKSASYRWVYDNIEKMGRKSLQDYIAKLKKEIEAFKGNEEVKLELTKKLAEAEEKLNVYTPDKLKEGAQLLQEMAGLAGEFNAELAEALNNVAGIANGLATAMAGFGTGNILQGLGGVVGIVTSISKLFSKNEESGSEKLTKWIAKLVKILQLQENALSLLSSNDQINEYTSLLAKATTSLDAIEAKTAKVVKSFLSDDDYGIGQAFTKLYNQLNIPLDASSWTSDDWLKAISFAYGDYKKQLESLYAEWIELQKQQQEYINAQNELLTGSTYDSIVESIVDGFADGYDSAADFADSFEELMKKAVLQALQVQFLEPKMQKWYKQFAEANKDGLTDKEIADLKLAYSSIITNASAYADALQTAAGITLGDESNDTGSDANTLSGAYKSMDQETANLLAGVNGAILIHVADIASAITGKFNENLKDAFGTDALKSTFGLGLNSINESIIKSNEQLVKIEENTRLLSDIKTLLSTKNKGFTDLFTNNRINGW